MLIKERRGHRWMSEVSAGGMFDVRKCAVITGRMLSEDKSM